METNGSPYFKTNFITGALLLALTGLAYWPVASALYYGGGWPVLQVIFLAIYIIGVRQIRRTAVPIWVKWVMYLAPVGSVLVMEWVAGD